MTAHKKKEKIGKIIIFGKDKKLFDSIENLVKESLEVWDTPEKMYNSFSKYVKNKRKIHFQIIGGTGKSPYLFEIKGKPSECSIEQIQVLYDTLCYYFANKD